MLKETLKSIILSQQDWITKDEREIQRRQLRQFVFLKPFCNVLTGVKGSGTSTLLKQIMSYYNSKKLLQF